MNTTINQSANQPSERTLYRTPLHGAILIPPLLLELIIVGWGGVLSFLQGAKLPMSYVWLLASAFLAVDFLYGISLYLNLKRAGIEMTDHRVTSRAGLFYGQNVCIDLERIQEIDSRRSRWGRVLGFGSVVIKDAVGKITELKLVPNPARLKYEFLMQKSRTVGAAH